MIHIAQCLCPQRHCMAAMAFDPAATPEGVAVESLRTAVREGIASEFFNPWCGICKSREFHYEVGVTRFRTMEEAMPHLKETERQNAIARALLGGTQN